MTSKGASRHADTSPQQASGESGSEEADPSPAEAALRRLAAERTLLLEHLACGVVLLSPHGTIAEANTRARRWLGLAPDAHAIPDAAAEDLLDPATLRPLRPEEAPWVRALAGAASPPLEVLRLGAGGHEHWLRLAANPVAGPEGLQAVVLILTDITVERHLARDLAATAAEHARLLGELTEQSQRLAALQQRFSLPSGRPAPVLTAREREVLALLGQGLTNADIARALDVTTGTARVYVKRILAELGVSNRTQAALRAVELGLSAPPYAR
jgi:DNA-binding CsgD family transcriptional regulator